MFGISFTEILLIVFIGLMVLGPQKIPEAVKSATRSILWLRKKTKEIKQEAWKTFGLNEIYQDSRNEEILEELEEVEK